MVQLSALQQSLQQLLQPDKYKDYPGAQNGLQLENNGQVTKLGAAVDATEAVFTKALAAGVDLLLIHHGMLWQPLRLTGAAYRKVKAALAGNLAVYSCHLPLDGNLEVGNAAEIARGLGIDPQPAFVMQGQAIGCRGALPQPLSREALRAQLAQVLGAAPHLCPGGPEQVQSVAILTGAGGSETITAAELGVDAFITGEASPHWSYTWAEEAGLNVYYGGHYLTETLGVIALAKRLSAEFGLPWEFIDHPTGL